MKLRNDHLRHIITEIVWAYGGVTTTDQIRDELARQRFTIAEPSSASLRNAVASSVRNGRLVRAGRGRLEPGRMTDGTRRRWRARSERLREYAVARGASTSTEAEARLRADGRWH